MIVRRRTLLASLVLLIAGCASSAPREAELFDVDIAVREVVKDRPGKVAATYRDEAYVLGTPVRRGDERGELSFSVDPLGPDRLRVVVDYQPKAKDAALLRVERVIRRDGRTGMADENVRARILVRPTRPKS